ncbi:MAG: hypothetical protein LBV01_02315, partial [Deltaproteobacteria bacterium]|nr:hypothetical protein [Deltaproteobacteria bacterium]
MTRGPLPLWQPPLFRQICLLAGIAGMLCQRFVLEGALALLLLALLALPALMPGRARPLLFLLSALAGFAFASLAAAPPLDQGRVPAWVKEAVTPDDDASGPRFAEGVRLTGTVRANTRLAGGRSRLVLGGARAAGEETPLPGDLVLTWQDPPPDIAG